MALRQGLTVRVELGVPVAARNRVTLAPTPSGITLLPGQGPTAGLIPTVTLRGAASGDSLEYLNTLGATLAGLVDYPVYSSAPWTNGSIPNRRWAYLSGSVLRDAGVNRFLVMEFREEPQSVEGTHSRVFPTIRPSSMYVILSPGRTDSDGFQQYSHVDIIEPPQPAAPAPQRGTLRIDGLDVGDDPFETQIAPIAGQTGAFGVASRTVLTEVLTGVTTGIDFRQAVIPRIIRIGDLEYQIRGTSMLAPRRYLVQLTREVSS